MNISDTFSFFCALSLYTRLKQIENSCKGRFVKDVSTLTFSCLVHYVLQFTKSYYGLFYAGAWYLFEGGS